MQNTDPELEQRVWQRVLGQSMPEPPGDDLKAMILSALETASVYRRLSGILSGKYREPLRQLYLGEMANVACMKGMYALGHSFPGKIPELIPPNDPATKALEKCYHRSRRAMTDFTARTADPEFGCLFAQMVKREEWHCALLAEILGRLQQAM